MFQSLVYPKEKKNSFVEVWIKILNLTEIHKVKFLGLVMIQLSTKDHV